MLLDLVNRLDRSQVHNHVMRTLAEVLKPDVALDIGTQTGDSAYQLALGGAGRVLTFDIVNHFNPISGFPRLERITFHQANLCDPEVAERYSADIAACSLVFLDVDPHDGLQEPKIVENLRKYQGRDIIMACDDISMTQGMRSFWANLEAEEKVDMPWAHNPSGFGLALLQRRGA